MYRQCFMFPRFGLCRVPCYGTSTGTHTTQTRALQDKYTWYAKECLHGKSMRVSGPTLAMHTPGDENNSAPLLLPCNKPFSHHSSLTVSQSHSLTDSESHRLTDSQSHHLTHSRPLSLTVSLVSQSHSLTVSPSHSLTHSHTLTL